MGFSTIIKPAHHALIPEAVIMVGTLMAGQVPFLWHRLNTPSWTVCSFRTCSNTSKIVVIIVPFIR